MFLQNDPRVALNLRWILTCFEKPSGMRINFHKSEPIPINMDVAATQPFLDIFQCVMGKFPVKYIGDPFAS
jgi:hypothetical protein